MRGVESVLPPQDTFDVTLREYGELVRDELNRRIDGGDIVSADAELARDTVMLWKLSFYVGGVERQH